MFKQLIKTSFFITVPAVSFFYCLDYMIKSEIEQDELNEMWKKTKEELNNKTIKEIKNLHKSHKDANMYDTKLIKKHIDIDIDIDKSSNQSEIYDTEIYYIDIINKQIDKLIDQYDETRD